MKLSDKIRILRKARGLSQEGLGDSLSKVNSDGISRQSVSDWENGKCEPKLDNIRDIAKVLNVSFDSLLDEDIDLDDADVLNSVLKHLSPEKKENVNSKFRYPIHQHNLSKETKSVIIYGAFFLAEVILVILATTVFLPNFIYFIFPIALLGAIIIGSTWHTILCIKRIIKGGRSYAFGELNNTHLIINAYGKAANTLYIPVEKIEKMEVGPKSTKRNGSVIINVTGRARPVTLINVYNPGELVEVFKNLKSFIEDPDEIKIL